MPLSPVKGVDWLHQDGIDVNLHARWAWWLDTRIGLAELALDCIELEVDRVFQEPNHGDHAQLTPAGLLL